MLLKANDTAQMRSLAQRRKRGLESRMKIFLNFSLALY
jgi:hypothetical protein